MAGFINNPQKTNSKRLAPETKVEKGDELLWKRKTTVITFLFFLGFGLCFFGGICFVSGRVGPRHEVPHLMNFI